MKKKIIISLTVVFAIAVICVGAFVINYHGGAPSGKGGYADETVESNSEFVLKTALQESDGIEMISFYIENLKGEKIFDSEGGQRTWDLHGIYFADNSNDVIVDTEDVGKIIFEYNGETWVCEEDTVEEKTVSVEQTLPWENWH